MRLRVLSLCPETCYVKSWDLKVDACRYLNATGLIWENAPAFGALIVFAEHRYYGVSKPFQKTLKEHMQFLTSEQAMADYAELITELKQELHAADSAVIGFGGSYGAHSCLLAISFMDCPPCHLSNHCALAWRLLCS